MHTRTEEEGMTCLQVTNVIHYWPNPKSSEGSSTPTKPPVSYRRCAMHHISSHGGKKKKKKKMDKTPKRGFRVKRKQGSVVQSQEDSSDQLVSWGGCARIVVNFRSWLGPTQANSSQVGKRRLQVVGEGIGSLSIFPRDPSAVTNSSLPCTRSMSRKTLLKC